ncbi:MAG TPA: VTT domain-containing protein [Allosphingosinicella sp.]
MRGRRLAAVAFLLIIVAVVAATYLTPLGDLLSIEGLKRSHARLVETVAASPILWGASFFCVAVLAALLCFPANPLIGITAGALFGFWPALVLVGIATPIGSTLAFLVARHLLRDWVKARLGARLSAIDRGIDEQGAFYMLALRWNPFVPYWLVNLAAGLTAMRLAVYVPIALIGLFPATFLYVSAGSQLAAIDEVGDVFPAGLIAALVVLSLLPLVAARFMSRRAR